MSENRNHDKIVVPLALIVAGLILCIGTFAAMQVLLLPRAVSKILKDPTTHLSEKEWAVVSNFVIGSDRFPDHRLDEFIDAALMELESVGSSSRLLTMLVIRPSTKQRVLRAIAERFDHRKPHSEWIASQLADEPELIREFFDVDMILKESTVPRTLVSVIMAMDLSESEDRYRMSIPIVREDLDDEAIARLLFVIRNKMSHVGTPYPFEEYSGSEIGAMRGEELHTLAKQFVDHLRQGPKSGQVQTSDAHVNDGEGGEARNDP